jgi:geranylgeranyl diphosphate synthase type I
VQDDWMDGDATRRGGPTVHCSLGRHYGSETLGAASAILAGDFAWGMALELLTQAKVDAGRTLRTLRELLAVHEQVLLGQQLDLLGPTHPSAGLLAGESLEAVELMHELKTGSYTVSGPLRVGARLAGASESTLRALGRFATPLGIAFQLRDDLLGVFADESHTGKPFANDLRAGKRTAVTVVAAGLLGVRGSEAYARVLGNAQASREQLLAAVRWLERCGARAAVEERLQELCSESARRALRLPIDPRARLWLCQAGASLLVPLPPLGDAVRTPAANAGGDGR